jgi:hypothetical protein
VRALKTHGQLLVGETFGMEYVSYILITMGILVVCFLLMRPPAMPLKKESRATVAQKPAAADPAREAEKAKRIFQYNLQRIPTPWGWPGHDDSVTNRGQRPLNAEEVHGVSESLHHFVGRIFSEKHTVDDREYLLRRNANLRLLVEDRYGRASTLKKQPGRQAKAPRHAGTSNLHDQMDNVNDENLNKIVSRIKKQPKELRTPWGW